VATSASGDEAPSGRRPYDSSKRREQAAGTRERVVAAGSELVRELPSWDWREVTFRAVAERAGVGERTVYRHFPTERHLHDAVMDRLEEEAGVSYDEVTLDDVPEVAALVFASLHGFAVRSEQMPADPTFEAAVERRQGALRRSVEAAAPQWTDEQKETAAALLDVLWNLPSYERLVSGWEFDGDRATEALQWLIAMVTAAVEADAPPPTPGSSSSSRGTSFRTA
jgi:AcrR family transcriptional regulator